MLVRLLYASRAGERLTSTEIDAILARSRAYNPGHGITGVLCYSGELVVIDRCRNAAGVEEPDEHVVSEGDTAVNSCAAAATGTHAAGWRP